MLPAELGSAALSQHYSGRDKDALEVNTHREPAPRASSSKEKQSLRALSKHWQKAHPPLFIFKTVTEGRDSILVLEILIFFPHIYFLLGAPA